MAATIQTGNVVEPLPSLEQWHALVLKPDSGAARCLTCMALVAMGRHKEGIAAYRALLKDHPTDATALNNLADTLATHPDPSLRNGAEAVHLATTACALSGGNNPAHLITLAEALAETGRFTEAVATAGEALILAREQGQQDLAEAIDSRLQSFRGGFAYRQPPR
jgi:cytochrome c-type biogenesis protein CcmH/NrfG